jgi:hypothetical protein
MNINCHETADQKNSFGKEMGGTRFFQPTLLKVFLNTATKFGMKINGNLWKLRYGESGHSMHF